MSIRDAINQAAFDESVRIRRKALALTPRKYAPGGPILRNTATGESFIPVGWAAAIGCPHRQAEPVILSTDETVACVCIACLAPLSANWITSQRDKAEREAHCTHERTWDDRRLGSGKTWRGCNGCGARWEIEG